MSGIQKSYVPTLAKWTTRILPITGRCRIIQYGDSREGYSAGSTQQVYCLCVSSTLQHNTIRLHLSALLQWSEADEETNEVRLSLEICSIHKPVLSRLPYNKDEKHGAFYIQLLYISVWRTPEKSVSAPSGRSTSDCVLVPSTNHSHGLISFLFLWWKQNIDLTGNMQEVIRSSLEMWQKPANIRNEDVSSKYRNRSQLMSPFLF